MERVKEFWLIVLIVPVFKYTLLNLSKHVSDAKGINNLFSDSWKEQSFLIAMQTYWFNYNK